MRLVCLILVVLSFGAGAFAQSESPLRVGTKSAPPFAMQNPDGEWIGVSIDLWRQVAGELGLTYELVETDLEELITGLAEGRLDASVAAVTITADRERSIDFCHPFFGSGLGIAVSREGGVGWRGIMRDVQLGRLVRTVGLLLALLLFIGFLMWLVEMRRNAKQFPPDMRGLGDGFWWSAVTMTTVGYGDKTPITGPGRVLGLAWMAASVFLISAFTATIASALTASQLDGRVRGPEDLPGVRVGTVSNSTGEQYLRRRQYAAQSYPNVEDAVAALADDRVDAVVYDAPILRYLIQKDYEQGAHVLAHRLAEESYAFGLPPQSPLREQINQAMLEKLSSPEWRETLTRYFGRQP